MVEKGGAALNYKIDEQITKFDVKMRNFEKKCIFFLCSKRIIWSAAREDPNICVLNVSYIYASTKRAIASTNSTLKPKRKEK